MKLVNRIIDGLQAVFPPNRVAILLAGAITALSGVLSAWLAAHFPGLSLGTTEIAVVLGAALLITLRLLDRWFDQWQAGEPLDVEGDLEQALEEFLGDPDARKVFLEAHPELFAAELAELNQKAVAADSSKAPAPPAAGA